LKEVVGDQIVHTLSYWCLNGDDGKLLSDGVVIYRKSQEDETCKKIVPILKIKNSFKGLWSNGEIVEDNL